MLKNIPIENGWFLLQFKPNSHGIAESNLNRQGFDTFLPYEEITEYHNNKLKTIKRPLFPGYMFISLNKKNASWKKVNSTYGVSKLVSFGSFPKSVSNEIIHNLINITSTSGSLLSPLDLNEGDNIKVINTPFNDFITVIHQIDYEQRIWILMDIMGRPSKMRLTDNQIIKS